jgi:hypothetical protein
MLSRKSLSSLPIYFKKGGLEMSDAAKKRITIGFNILLFIYLCFDHFAEYLAAPENPVKAPLDKFFERSPILSIALTAGFILFLIGTGAYLLKSFWNRFIGNVFKVRDITFQEATSILLVAVVVLG